MTFNQIIGDIVIYGPMVIAAAASAAAVFPQGTPGTPWYVVRGVIDALALNVANAKNAVKK